MGGREFDPDFEYINRSVESLKENEVFAPKFYKNSYNGRIAFDYISSEIFIGAHVREGDFVTWVFDPENTVKRIIDFIRSRGMENVKGLLERGLASRKAEDLLKREDMPRVDFEQVKWEGVRFLKNNIDNLPDLARRKQLAEEELQRRNDEIKKILRGNRRIDPSGRLLHKAEVKIWQKQWKRKGT